MSIKSIESIVISASQFRTLLDLWTQNETKNDQLAAQNVFFVERAPLTPLPELPTHPPPVCIYFQKY